MLFNQNEWNALYPTENLIGVRASAAAARLRKELDGKDGMTRAPTPLPTTPEPTPTAYAGAQAMMPMPFTTTEH
jgi:hypothetical protein